LKEQNTPYYQRIQTKVKGQSDKEDTPAACSPLDVQRQMRHTRMQGKRGPNSLAKPYKNFIFFSQLFYF